MFRPAPQYVHVDDLAGYLGRMEERLVTTTDQLKAAIDALTTQAAATKAAVELAFSDLLTKSSTPTGVSEQDIQAAIDQVNSVTVDLATLAGEATQADSGTPPPAPAPAPSPAPAPAPGPNDPSVTPTPAPPANGVELVLRRGIDYTSRIDPHSVRSAGYDFVIRYVDDPAHARWKTITNDEYNELVAAGVDVMLVFEIRTDDAEGGSIAGFPNARRAVDGAHALGYPDGHPLFFAIDEHIRPDQMDTVREYLEAAENTVANGSRFRFGVYGFPEVITAVSCWYPDAALWACGHRPPPGVADIWQRNDGSHTVGGVDCDVNEQYRPLL